MSHLLGLLIVVGTFEGLLETRAWGQAVDIQTNNDSSVATSRMQFATGAAPATVTILNSRLTFASSAYLTLPTGTSDPTDTTSGNLYYNSSSGLVLYRHGGAWVALGTSSTFATGGILFGNNTSTAQTDAANFFWDNSSRRLGLATSSPSYALSFGGNAARYIGMERHTTGNMAGNTLSLQAGGATTGATDKNGGTLMLQGGTATGTGTSEIWFLTAGGGLTGTTDSFTSTRMVLDGSGRLGIGTTLPSVRLHAATDDSATNTVTNILQLNHSSSGALGVSFGTGLLFTGESTTTDGRDMARVQAIWTTATDASRASALQFQTLTNGGSMTTQMTIAGDGKVGIGTTSPAATLDLSGSLAQREISLTLSNGDNNHNVNLVTESVMYRVTGPTAAFTITGIAGGVNGRGITLYNPTGQSMTLANESSASTAANRIQTQTGTNVSISGNSYVNLYYSSTDSRWNLTVSTAVPVIRASKASDESVTSSTTFQDDDDLKFSVSTNETWYVELLCFVNTGSSPNPDIKFQLTGPTGASIKMSLFDETGNFSKVITAYSSSTGVVAIGANTTHAIRFRGTVTTASTAGTIVLQWAQDTSNTASTVVEQKSFLIAHRQ